MRHIGKILKWYVISSLVVGVGGALAATTALPRETLEDRIIVPLCQYAPDLCHQLFVP